MKLKGINKRSRGLDKVPIDWDKSSYKGSFQIIRAKSYNPTIKNGYMLTVRRRERRPYVKTGEILTLRHIYN